MSLQNPLVSIVVPAYNHEKYVGECIESIINQTYQNIELIIINDGSKDKTADIIRTYETKCIERFKRFIFINKNNEGICKTLNKGIRESKGEYFCFIASDDCMTNNCINQIVEFFSENKEVERVISNFYMYYFSENKKLLYYKNAPKWITYMNINNNKFLKQNIIQNQLTVFGMYRRTVIDKVGLFDENILFEDWDMNLRIISNNVKIGYVKEPLFYYRQHSNNTCNANNFKFMLDGCLQIIEKVDKDNTIVFRDKAKIIKKSRSCRYIDVARALKQNNNIEFKRYVKIAMCECPSNITIYKFLIDSFIKDTIGPKLTKAIKTRVLKR
ncbi:glycosyltransferase [Clostridium estertheticum]|uniref:glycosyltransferase n=1 Tax=Clostridium estertheticum TaxID=238834 RepID=UPI001C6F1354|nr:glycosyltransferase [Clostridium estertheticum]MBW9151359.1 glycosyltransferase [Clostridium estertheticum]WLC84666.1 glycosyltransferase [Clostridium estertheticum]